MYFTKLAGDNVKSNNGGPGKEPSETPCKKMSNNTACTFNLTAKDKKTIVRILCIVGVLYLTNVPIMAAFVYATVKGTDGIFLHYLYPWSASVGLTGGVMNAYIYFYKNEHFRTRTRALRCSFFSFSDNTNCSISWQNHSLDNSIEQSH